MLQQIVYLFLDETGEIKDINGSVIEDKTVIEVQDFGAGSAIVKTTHRSIAEIARHAAKPKKYGQLLYRIALYYGPKTIVELEKQIEEVAPIKR